MPFDFQPRDTAPEAEAAFAPETSFRSVSRLAVVAMALAALGTLAFVDWTLLALPVLAVVLGVVALGQVRRAPERLTGRTLALVAIGWATLAGLAGMAYQYYAERAEVPHGYLPVTYRELQADPDNPNEAIPRRAYELVDKRIFVKGYMYPTRSSSNIKEFVISRDNGSCQFCIPNPRPTDLIRVTLDGDLRTRYRTDLLRIGGKFKIDESQIGRYGGVVYHLEADYLK